MGSSRHRSVGSWDAHVNRTSHDFTASKQIQGSHIATPKVVVSVRRNRSTNASISDSVAADVVVAREEEIRSVNAKIGSLSLEQGNSVSGSSSSRQFSISEQESSTDMERESDREAITTTTYRSSGSLLSSDRDGAALSRRSWDNESDSSDSFFRFGGRSVVSIGESKRTRRRRNFTLAPSISVDSDNDIRSEQSWSASEMSEFVRSHLSKNNIQATNFKGTEPRMREFYHQNSLTPFQNRASGKERQFGQPLFPETNGYCCTHCIPETCRPFERSVHGVCCRNGMCRDCSHTCCCATGSWYNSPPCSHSNHHHGYDERRKLYNLEDMQRRHCMPVNGGADLILCYTCFWVLQIPKDLPLSQKKKFNIQCGHCGEFLSYFVSDGIHIEPPWYTYLRRVPDESIDNNNQRRKDPAADANKLHRLMGYYSARDILYEISNSDSATGIIMREVPKS